MVVSTLLLMLPVSKRGPGSASLLEALFTATSSVCVTGLTVVDTPTYWSPFGLVVILMSIQVGGFGIMTLASVLALLVSKRLGLRTRLGVAAETHALGLGDLRVVLRGVAITSLLVEGCAALVLGLRWSLAYDEPIGRAAWLGVFHAVSAFNNAGMALFSDNLVSYAADPVLGLTLCVAVILGGLGFPVLFELRRFYRTPRSFSLHSKIVLAMTAVLLFVGWGLFLAFEWANPSTLGRLDVPGKLLAGFFQGVMPRTAGFNSVPLGDLHPETLFGSGVLMFIGGGSAGTAGGIKVTTFAVLLLVMWGEMRGEPSVNAFNRRLPRSVQRQALTVALLAVAVVVAATVVLLALTPFALDVVLYEVVSAFATVGLSTGITAQVGVAGQLLLIGLMFVGRIGTVTLGSALALRSRPRLYDLPKERPLIG